MKTNSEFELRIASYCLVGLGVLGAVWYIAWRNDSLSNVAAWVQAVGSIAAIWGAFVIGERQALQAQRTARLEQKIREHDWILAVIEVMHQIEIIMGKAIDDVEESSENGSPLATIKLWCDLVEPLLRQLDAVPLHQPPYSRVASQLVRFRAGTNFFLQQMKSIAGKRVVPTIKQRSNLVRWRNITIRISNEVRKTMRLPQKAIQPPTRNATGPRATNAAMADG